MAKALVLRIPAIGLALAAVAAAAPVRVGTTGSVQQVIEIGDFQNSTVGQFPAGWSWRKARDTGDAEKARKDGVDVFRYVVQEENGNKYVHVRDEFRPGDSVGLYVETEDLGWKVMERPILSWRWRVNEVPPGADERFTETNDSPASVSVVYGTKFPFTPITIKWVWSSTLPIGAVTYRPGRGRAHTIVLGTGSDRIGEWITIERDILSDYVAIHGKLPPDEPRAIVISSDANRTPGGAADADYDDFRILSEYSPGFPQEPLVLRKEFMADNRW